MADKLEDALASFERGSRNVGRGVLDVAQFPSYVLNQLVGSADLAGKIATGKSFLESTGLDKYLGFDAYQRGVAAGDKLLLNYDPADETPVDRATRIAAGALVPVPAATVAPGIRNVQQAPTLARVIETAIPGTPVPGASVGTLAANAVVPIAIDAGVQAGIDALAPGIEVVDLADEPPQIQAVDLFDEAQIEPVDMIADSDQEDSMSWGLMLAAGVAAGLGALVARRSANLNKFVRKTEESPDTVASIQSGLKNLLYDDKAGVIDRLREVNAEQIIDAIRTTIPTQAMGSRVIESMHSGQFINSQLRLTRADGTKLSVANLLSAMTKLPGDKQQSFERLMRLSDDMDRVRNGLPTTSRINDIGLLSNEVAQLRNDPVLAAMQDDYLLTFRKTLEWAVEQGYVSKDKQTGLLLNQPAYSPAVPLQASGPLDRILHAVLPEETRDSIYDTLRFMTQRSVSSTDPIRNLLSAPQSLELYFAAMSTAVTRNAVLRDTLKALEETPWVTRLNAKPGDLDQVVTVKKNGEIVYYKVNAPELYQSLDFTPERLNKVVTAFNTSRKIAQAGSTGTFIDIVSTALTGVPLFLARGMSYEAAMTTLLRPNRGGGPLEQLKEIGKDATRLVAAPITVSGRVLNSEISRIFAQELASSHIAQTGPYKALEAVLGSQRLQTWHRAAMENYLNSTMRAYNRGGGGFAAYTDVADVDNIRSLLTTTMPRYATWAAKETGGRVAAAQTAMGATYKIASAIHNTAQNAWRIEYMAQHYKPGMKDADFTKLMREAGELSGDFRVKGSEHVFRPTVPYGNVMVQSTRQIMNMMKDHPVRMATVLTGMAATAIGSVAYQTWNDPEFRDLYWNRLTPAQRTQGLVYADPNNPDGWGYMFTWPNEISGLIGMMTETLADTLGMKTGEFYQNPDMLEALIGAKLQPINERDLAATQRAGLERYLGREGPLGAPLFQGIAAATGNRIDVPGALRGEGDVFKPAGSDPDVIGAEVKAQGQYLSNLTTEMIDAQFGQFGSLMIAFANGVNAPYGARGIDAGLHKMQEELEKRQARSLPFNAQEQQLSVWTAASPELYEKKAAFNNLLEIDRQKNDPYTKDMYANYPNELKQAAFYATQLKTTHDFNSRMLNKMRRDLALFQRRNASTDELNETIKDLQDMQKSMLGWYDEFEFTIRDRMRLDNFKLKEVPNLAQSP